jgi:hypothetical protein
MPSELPTVALVGGALYFGLQRYRHARHLHIPKHERAVFLAAEQRCAVLRMNHDGSELAVQIEEYVWDRLPTVRRVGGKCGGAHLLL